MATLSHSTSQYRDGVFSAASPAPNYGQLTRVFENGSLGNDGSDLETDAAAILDTALDKVIASLQPGGLESRALPPEALVAASTAIALATAARAELDVQKKLVLATAASYSAAFFGLPRNTLLYTVDQVCGMFAMTAYQRRQYHQEAARVLDNYVASLKQKKGSPMSGAYRDGSLGILMQQGATRDGSLGAAMYQPGAFHDGALGAGAGWGSTAWGRMRSRAGLAARTRLNLMPAAYYNRPGVVLGPTRRRASATSGLGCGCSGVGDDGTVLTATETQQSIDDRAARNKKILMIGGGAVVLAGVLYAITR
jgi:hypothetical protein